MFDVRCLCGTLLCFRGRKVKVLSNRPFGAVWLL